MGKNEIEHNIWDKRSFFGTKWKKNFGMLKNEVFGTQKIFDFLANCEPINFPFILLLCVLTTEGRKVQRPLEFKPEPSSHLDINHVHHQLLEYFQ